MRRSMAAWLLGAWVIALTAACEIDNEDYCRTDADCTPRGAASLCQPQGHVCYEKCKTDAECADVARIGYFEGNSTCAVATGHCITPVTTPDAGPDMPKIDSQNKFENGTTCVSKGQCKSGVCDDGVCCDVGCSATCSSCNLTATKGTCTKIGKGLDPDKECPLKAKACGPGTCDGNGACDYAAKTTACEKACKKQSDGTYTLETKFCDEGANAGQCGTAKVDTKCQAYKCTGTNLTSACATSCGVHDDCIAASACDRSMFHAARKGACVDVAKIAATASSTTSIATAVAAVSATKPYVRIEAGNYKEQVVLKADATLIGMTTGTKTAVIDVPAVTSSVGVKVEKAAKVALQGLTIQSAKADGIACGEKSTLTVVDSLITKNDDVGIETNDCSTLVLRRNQITKNSGGGLDMFKGTAQLTVVNNVFAGNGTLSSDVGGARIAATSITFVNNTLAENPAKGTAHGGVICVTALTTVSNSIISNNGGLGTSGCLYASCSADFRGTPKGWKNLAPNFVKGTGPHPYSLNAATSKCIDAGDITKVTGMTAADLTRGVRVKSTKVDIGAYEVK